jgi:hypothetical protein
MRNFDQFPGIILGFSLLETSRTSLGLIHSLIQWVIRGHSLGQKGRSLQLTNQSYIAKVKVKVKVKFTLEQATKAQRWSRGIALLFL